MVTSSKESRMSGVCGTHGKRRVMYTELRRKRDALKDICEDNIKIDLKRNSVKRVGLNSYDSGRMIMCLINWKVCGVEPR
jgi:hypothetical protein